MLFCIFPKQTNYYNNYKAKTFPSRYNIIYFMLFQDQKHIPTRVTCVIYYICYIVQALYAYTSQTLFILKRIIYIYLQIVYQ